MERRWGNRVVLDETVAVKRDGQTIGVACLHECSLSGAFLKTPWRLPQLARLSVEMPHAAGKRHGDGPEDGHNGDTGLRARRRRHDDEYSIVEAFVVRHCADGVGLEWCDFAPQGVAELMEERRRIAALPVTLERSQPRMRR